ncbi:SMI1/KNR4 family protein [Haloferula chungangensis]|uniref:SMI1/KNR4 family protein n=2 Tax=Haloferula chungangensis TaxID=1048331 RepID=A0ABW2LB09_9BACT
MHTEAWQQIVSALTTSLAQLRAKEVEVSDLEDFDPPPLEQIDELEREMGIKLPETFRQFLAITGGFRFDWEAESGPFDDIAYGGNSEVDFLRGSEELTLAEAYREFQEHYEGFDVEDGAQIAIIRRCFPLFLTDGGGNSLAIRLDTDPLQIHLLKSELCWYFSDIAGDEHKSLVGRGLPEFLLHWASLGGPATEDLSVVVEACGGDTLDANSAGGRAIREWLATPE